MGTTAEKLNKLKATKTAIKQAIIDKGVAVADSDTFATYPEKITAIPSGGGDVNNDVSLLTGSWAPNSEYKIPDGVTGSIRDVFSSVKGLKLLNTNKTKRMKGASGATDLEELVWGEDISLAQQYAFSYCYKLKKVTGQLKTIAEEYLFDGCNLLNEIDLPNLIEVKQGAFRDCGLKNAVSIFNNVKKIDSQGFKFDSDFEKDNLITLDLPVVEEIYLSAFSNRQKLQTVHIGNKITLINSSAFDYCNALKTITIDKPKDSIAGAPWGAYSATVIWNG